MVSPVFIKPALVALVTTAIICIVIAVTRNGSNHSVPVQSAFQSLPQNIDIALKQARFSEMKDGAVVWELVAGKVEYDKSGEIAHLTGGIQMDFMRTKASDAVKVIADSGEYLSNNKNVKLRGNVHVLKQDGTRFDTDSIDYTAATSRFKTADMLTFRHERLMLNAIGMEMDVKDQKTRFYTSVDATVAGVSVRRTLPGFRSESVVKPAKKKIAKKTKKRRRGNKR